MLTNVNELKDTGGSVMLQDLNSTAEKLLWIQAAVAEEVSGAVLLHNCVLS